MRLWSLSLSDVDKSSTWAIICCTASSAPGFILLQFSDSCKAEALGSLKGWRVPTCWFEYTGAGDGLSTRTTVVRVSKEQIKHAIKKPCCSISLQVGSKAREQCFCWERETCKYIWQLLWITVFSANVTWQTFFWLKSFFSWHTIGCISLVSWSAPLYRLHTHSAAGSLLQGDTSGSNFSWWGPTAGHGYLQLVAWASLRLISSFLHYQSLFVKPVHFSVMEMLRSL